MQTGGVTWSNEAERASIVTGACPELASPSSFRNQGSLRAAAHSDLDDENSFGRAFRDGSYSRPYLSISPGCLRPMTGTMLCERRA